MMTTETILPLNGSGFGGTLNVDTNMPGNAQWNVFYQNFSVINSGIYLNVCRARSGNPLLIKSIKFVTTVNQLNNSLVRFSRRLITGITNQQSLKIQANNKMYKGVKTVKFPGDLSLNFETSMELDIDPQTTIDLIINYEKQYERLSN